MTSLHRLGPIRLRLDIELDIDEPELIALLGRVVAASGLHQGAQPLYAPMERLLSPSQLAEEVGVTMRCIANWQRQGMPTLNRGGRPRFKLSEVTEWMRGRQAKREAKPTKQAA